VLQHATSNTNQTAYRPPTRPSLPSEPFVIFATFCADSLLGFTPSGDDRDRRIHSQKIAKVSKKGSRKAGFHYLRESSRYLQGQAGRIQDFCRDPTPRIDRLQLFVIFAAFCADSLRGFTVSGDDRYGRIHSQKLAKVSKRGSRKTGFHYPRDSSRYL